MGQRVPTTRLIVAACFASTVLLSAESALACDAPPGYPGTPAARLSQLDVVARGTVTSLRSRSSQAEGRWVFPDNETFWGAMLELLPPDYHSRLVIEVDEAWKGVTFDEIVVHDEGPGCCGTSYAEVGDEVLVYARAYEGVLWTDGRCAPIFQIADAQADLDYLGPGQRELRSKALQRALIGVVAVPIVLGGLLLWRRRIRTSACASAASPAA
jgi:hypothetical protein